MDFFCINNILDLDAHYLKSAQQKRPAWAVRTFTFILSSLCLTVRKASLSLKWDGVYYKGGEELEMKPLMVCWEVDFVEPIFVLKHTSSDLY